MMDNKRPIDVPVHRTRPPHDFEIMAIPLIKTCDFGVLKVRYSVPVGTVHGVRFVSHLLHVNFGF